MRFHVHEIGFSAEAGELQRSAPRRRLGLKAWIITLAIAFLSFASLFVISGMEGPAQQANDDPAFAYSGTANIHDLFR